MVITEALCESRAGVRMAVVRVCRVIASAAVASGAVQMAVIGIHVDAIPSDDWQMIQKGCC